MFSPEFHSKCSYFYEPLFHKSIYKYSSRCCILSLFVFLSDSISSNEAAVLLSLSFATVAVNSLVIIAIWKDPFKDLKGTANYLILNLSICDLLVGIPGELLFGLLHWFPNNNITRAAYTIIYLAFYASFLTILGLAVERLIVISSPRNSATYSTSSYLTLGVMSIWLFAGLLAFLPVLGWDSFDSYRVFICDVVTIPILILLFACYTRIYFVVRKRLYLDITTAEERKEEGQGLTESARRIEKLKRKERSVAYSVFILVGIFAVCWIPGFVLENINEFCSSCLKNYKSVSKLLNGLVFLHPLLNPIAYSLRTVKFRKALWKICKELCRAKSASTSSSRRAII